MSTTTDAAPERPERSEAVPAATDPPAPTRQPVGERLGAHPILLGAAALVVAAGGAFGAGYAVGDATNDDRPAGPRAQEMADPPRPPLDDELPGLRERDNRRDQDGPGRDRFRGERDIERDRSGRADSGT